MKILSIDVGIKNLAYCLFNIHNKICDIQSWDVLDICNMCEKKMCQHPNCNYKAKYIKGDEFYCKTHSKKSKYKIPDKECTHKAIKKMKLGSIKEYCEKHNIDTQTCKLKQDYINKALSYIDTNFFTTIKDKNANSMTLVTLGKNLMNQFDNCFDSTTIDIILIENQISPIANRMKTLQGMISQYFIMKGVQQIEFVSSSNKLKKYLDSGKTTYNERKKKGIEIVHNKLIDEKKDKWKLFFTKHKKKDDLADCYLQGLWFIDEFNYSL